MFGQRYDADYDRNYINRMLVASTKRDEEDFQFWTLHSQ